MIKRKPRSDQKDFAYPKMVRKSVRKSRKAKTPEDIIQGVVDTLLDLYHVPYLRLPANLFRGLFGNPQIPIWTKKHLKLAIAGWPDNMAFLPLDDKYCLCCMIENKSDIGKLHGMQKIRSKELPFNICRTQEDALKLIDEFKEMADKIKDGMK